MATNYSLFHFYFKICTDVQLCLYYKSRYQNSSVKTSHVELACLMRWLSFQFASAASTCIPGQQIFCYIKTTSHAYITALSSLFIKPIPGYEDWARCKGSNRQEKYSTQFSQLKYPGSMIFKKREREQGRGRGKQQQIPKPNLQRV